MRGKKEGDTLQSNFSRHTKSVIARASQRVSCLILILRRNLTRTQKHQIIHSDCINRLHSVNHVTFMAFQHNTFTVPLALACVFSIPSAPPWSHCKMKWLMMKGLTQGWTLLPHSCRTSAVWLTDWLAGWQTDCGQIWTGLLFGAGGGGRKELVMSPELTWKHTREERNKERERERETVTENVRRIGVLLYAPCGGIHACMPFGLSSTSACVICCFRCVKSQLPGGALYLCVQARIWCSVHWLGHGSWPEVLLDRVWISLLLFWEEFSHTAAPSATFRRGGL